MEKQLRMIKGDLITLAKKGEFNVIIHGCNCCNSMSAGIASQIKKHFRMAYTVDQETIKNDKSKLGTYSMADCGNVIVINAYIEYKYGKKGKIQRMNYEALRDVLHKVAHDFPDKKIGIPKIGTGYGGGKWSIIQDIIYSELGDNVTVVLL